MKNLMKRFAQDESGATAIEYGLIAAGISVPMPATITRVRALLVLLAGLLIGLSPAAALAHGGAGHEQGEVGFDSRSVEHSWSPACPPGSGHVCGCGNLSLCHGSGEFAVLPSSAAALLFASDTAPAPELRAAPRIAPRFSPSVPRAPPALSLIV